MINKKPTSAKQTPVHVIRCGEVAASIYVRQSNAGYAYFDFVLSRCWTSMASGKEAHGNSFFDRNEQDLTCAIHEATDWIRSKLQPSLGDQPLTSEDNPPQ